jgi:hypothetical protein
VSSGKDQIVSGGQVPGLGVVLQAFNLVLASTAALGWQKFRSLERPQLEGEALVHVAYQVHINHALQIS